MHLGIHGNCKLFNFFPMFQGSIMPFFFCLCYPYTEKSKIDELWDSIFIYLFYLILLVRQFFCNTAGRFMSFFYCFLNSSNKKSTFESIKQNISEKLFCLFCVRRPSTWSKRKWTKQNFFVLLLFCLFLF